MLHSGDVLVDSYIDVIVKMKVEMYELMDGTNGLAHIVFVCIIESMLEGPF